MTDYIINYTNPLKGSFIIKPYTSNGNRFPTTSVRNSTSASANTPLLLFGKGHPEYGERTDENLFHMLEHFSGPSAPIIDVFENTIAGSLWHADIVYFYESSTTWWQWSGSSWTDVSSNVSGPGQPASPNNGDLWYDNTYLYRYSDDERGISSWIKVEFDEGSSSPNTSPIRQPTRELRINHDGTSTSWISIPDSDALDTTYLRLDTTNSPLTGDLEINKTTPVLDLVGSDPTVRFRGGINFQMSGNDGSSTFEIRRGAVLGTDVFIEIDNSTGVISHREDTASNYASNISGNDQALTNKYYVDSVAASVSGDTFVNSGSFSLNTLTLNYNGSPETSFNVTGLNSDVVTTPNTSPEFTIGTTPVSTVTEALEELDSQKASLSGASFTGNVSFTGVSVTGDNPSTPSELATKDYVDSATGGSTGAFERYIITGTTSPILIPDFPSFSYTAGEYRLFVFKNGLKLYANDTSTSPITEYGYYEILITGTFGSPVGSPFILTLGSPLNISYPSIGLMANAIELTTSPIISDVFEIILIQ